MSIKPLPYYTQTDDVYAKATAQELRKALLPQIKRRLPYSPRFIRIELCSKKIQTTAHRQATCISEAPSKVSQSRQGFKLGRKSVFIPTRHAVGMQLYC